MNTRHVQSFLMVSAAFFAMSGRTHTRGVSALAVAAGVQMRPFAAADEVRSPPSTAARTATRNDAAH
ncbi:conserved protein of unknown function [Burkholderia multivorans]